MRKMEASDTTKYIIHAQINAEGVVERPDVVGAIFGQTEGLLGSDLDLRDLQKTGRIGRIEVNIESKFGKSIGTILIPSSLDKIETSILAAALETVDRVGPCIASIKVERIEDVRVSKRKQIIERAKVILTSMFDEGVPESQELVEAVKQAVKVEEITLFGEEGLPAGPNVMDSDAIIIVEGRADVLNLLKYGIKNAIAVEGTNVPTIIGELSKKKTVTVFLDGDRGGDLLLKELLQVAEVDYVARAPEGKSVEDLTQKEVIKALRNKLPVEQVVDIQQVKERRLRRRELTSRRKIFYREEGRVEELTKALEPQESEKNSDDFKRFVAEISGTLSAKLLDGNRNVIKEVAVRDLAKALKETDANVRSVVFDGVITQRIIDIAAEKKLDYLVGVKLGNIVKKPLSIKILTPENL
jgi:DNA primase